MAPDVRLSIRKSVNISVFLNLAYYLVDYFGTGGYRMKRKKRKVEGERYEARSRGRYHPVS